MTAAATRARYPVADLPPDYLVLGRAGTENFPVASRLLPAGLRADLLALYGWARLVDQLGDDYAGDRLAALDEVERQLLASLGAFATGSGRAGQPAGAGGELSGHSPARGTAAISVTSAQAHPLVAAVAAMARRRGLPVQPLLDLVHANRQDQLVKSYETFADLVGYCELSANPVGRMVLAIFGADTPERSAWSDNICTALQLVEHFQDVAEDAIVGRVYLPQEDLRRFGVSTDELVPPRASYVDRRRRGAEGGAPVACRALLAFECARARRVLEEGTPLVGSLHGRLRYAVAGFVAGGHAALDALAGVGFDIYADTPRPARRRYAAQLVRVLEEARKPAERHHAVVVNLDRAGLRGEK